MGETGEMGGTGETCGTCNTAVRGASVLYAPDGRMICQGCFDKLDPSSVGIPAPWRKLAISGGVAGAIPFFISFANSSSTTVNGEVTSLVYRDWLAVACGVVAIVLGAMALAAGRKEELQRGLARAAGAGVLLLGALQIARGFGLFGP